MYRTQGYSKRGIARELDISRKTVHKVLAEYESSLMSADPETSLEAVLTTVSRYNSGNRQRSVIRLKTSKQTWQA
jgi:transposase-like protein